MIFRRRSKPTDEQIGSDAVEAAGREHSGRSRGPWDRGETSTDEGDPNYVDLGGLVVRGREGLELRLQVDEQTQTVASVLLAGPQSGLELRAFAAPRHDGLWDDVRADIAAEATKRGGTATEVDGEWGTELKLVVPVQTPDGRKASQASRIVGIEGPRWLLRATFLGDAGLNPSDEGLLMDALKDVIVVRGEDPRIPREPLMLVLPANAVVAPDEVD